MIGLGAFGSTVATELARADAYVLGIDIVDKRVARMAETVAEAKILDASDEAALREAGVDRFGAVVICIGEDIESSILCTMNARLLGCKTIWVKARDRTHHRILTKLGADRVILPEQEVGQHVAQSLLNPAVRDYASMGNGYHAVCMIIPEGLESRSVGAARSRRALLPAPARADARHRVPRHRRAGLHPRGRRPAAGARQARGPASLRQVDLRRR